MGPAEEKVREEEEVMVANQISMAERVNSAVAEANSFREECHRVGCIVSRMKRMLRTLIDYVTAAQTLYDRPIGCIVAEVSKNLERALTLVRKCKRWTLLRRLVIGNRTTEFSRIFTLLESSIANLNWLLSLFDPYTGCATGEWNLSLPLPPIAIHEPAISWAWSFIATLKMGKLKNRIQAANNLASLAQVNEMNKRIIEEEGGIPLLVKLLRDTFPPEAQIAAASALYILSDDQERVRAIMTGGGIPAIVHLLRASPIRVQIQAASLVARLAEKYPWAQEAFAEEHVVVPLVKLLSFELLPELLIPQFKHKQNSVYEMKNKINKHNSVGLNPEIDNLYTNFCLNWFFEGSNAPAKMQKKEWETVEPEVKLQLKLNCSKALWVLARGSESISKTITERNGLMCLAKLIEKERNELQLNCLMIAKEIAAAAEQQANFRHLAFKTNFPGVRAVIDELLRVIKESEGPELQIPAIRSIGSLARIFPAREIRVIESLVAQIRNKHREVAEEAVIALQKFVCEGHFLRSEHSKSIIKLNGVAALMPLIGKASQQAMVLLGYLNDRQPLERYWGTETGEKNGSARWMYMMLENPANAFENLTNSKASSIGPNMETKWPMRRSKTIFPNDLLCLTPVIGPCSCTYCGLLVILAELNFIPDIQELSSWFSSSFATGLYGGYILKIVLRGISFEMVISGSANTLSFQIKIETSRTSMYNYSWSQCFETRTGKRTGLLTGSRFDRSTDRVKRQQP